MVRRNAQHTIFRAPVSARSKITGASRRSAVSAPPNTHAPQETFRFALLLTTDSMLWLSHCEHTSRLVPVQQRRRGHHSARPSQSLRHTKTRCAAGGPVVIFAQLSLIMPTTVCISASVIFPEKRRSETMIAVLQPLFNRPPLGYLSVGATLIAIETHGPGRAAAPHSRSSANSPNNVGVMSTT